MKSNYQNDIVCVATVDSEDDQKTKQDVHEIDLEEETYLQALLKGKK